MNRSYLQVLAASLLLAATPSMTSAELFESVRLDGQLYVQAEAFHGGEYESDSESDSIPDQFDSAEDEFLSRVVRIDADAVASDQIRYPGSSSSANAHSTASFVIGETSIVWMWWGSAAVEAPLLEGSNASGSAYSGSQLDYYPQFLSGSDKAMGTLVRAGLGEPSITTSHEIGLREVVKSGGLNPVDIGAGFRVNGKTEAVSDQFYYSFTLEGFDPPGKTPENPFRRFVNFQGNNRRKFDSLVKINVIVDEGNDINQNVGIQRTPIFALTTLVPVVEGDLGHAAPIYIDPDYAIGYGYTTDGTNRFHTFEIPSPLQQGDGQFEIHYLGQSYPLAAGEAFDFTTLDPTGVESFLLLGIDEAETLDPSDDGPFVYGATFMQPGIAEVTSFPLVRVPEPSAASLALLALIVVMVRRRLA